MAFFLNDTIKDTLNIAAQLSTVGGFAYALFWLERYRKQKQLENHSDNARKALDQLVLLEEAVDTLFSNGDTAPENNIILHKSLPVILRELYKILLLLRSIPNIPEQIQLIEKLSDAVADKDEQPRIAITKVYAIYGPHGGYKNASQKLKALLLRIYTLNS
jgi:hypothetical protein